MEETFNFPCRHVRELGLRDAEDEEIFRKARETASLVMTKDEDFVRILERIGPPPQIIWVTTGNMSNDHFKSLLLKTFPDAMLLISTGEPVVEIRQRL